MNHSLTKTRSGEVKFCTSKFCFVADGENGKILAMVGNMLIIAATILTIAQSFSTVVKALK